MSAFMRLSLLLLLCLLLAPAAARASTIAIRAQPDVAAEKPTAIEIVGTFDGDAYDARVRIKPAAVGASCLFDGVKDNGEEVGLFWDLPAAYDQAMPVSFSRPGAWLVCAWIKAGLTSETLASTSAVISVRPPHDTVRVTGAARLRVGRPARYVVHFGLEIPRDVLWTIVPGRACRHAWEAATVDAVDSGWSDESGVGEIPLTATFRRPGWFTVCGFVQTAYPDAQAQVIAARHVRVISPRRRRPRPPIFPFE